MLITWKFHVQLLGFVSSYCIIHFVHGADSSVGANICIFFQYYEDVASLQLYIDITN